MLSTIVWEIQDPACEIHSGKNPFCGNIVCQMCIFIVDESWTGGVRISEFENACVLYLYVEIRTSFAQ
jgi:hypothetical protein